jgi:3-hydroxyisobutyrate dehydrogenase-like beta-hydroxyacid dehydrogenase
MASLGFIGLGRMGTPMAANLLAAGHSLAVYARRPQAAAPVAEKGAIVCASPREVADRSDVVFTMLTDTKAVESVVFGDQGISAAARPGLVFIDHSTIAPRNAQDMAVRLRREGVEMLDAPVSGGVAGAQAGTLSIMVGGNEQVFERHRPLLSHLGTTVIHIGANGSGQIAKACNQICILVNQLGVAEAVMVAQKSGVDFEKVKRALMGGFAASRILEIQGPKMAEGRYEGEIESRLHYKDILLSIEWARELGAHLPASELAAEILGELQDSGGGRLDSAAVFTILQNRS